MTGHLFVSGDAGFIRIWDLESETAIQDVNTGSDTCVTTLCSSADNQNHIIAGCGDGTVRIFDSRVAGRFGSLLTFYDHKDWVINLNSPRLSDGKKIISGSIQGDVKFIDISAPTSAYKSIQALPANFMSAFAVHDYMPVLACGSSNQKIKVYNFSGEEMNEIRYHDGFLAQRIGPVSSLTFHPYIYSMAGGATDSLVSLYAPMSTTFRPK